MSFCHSRPSDQVVRSLPIALGIPPQSGERETETRGRLGRDEGSLEFIQCHRGPNQVSRLQMQRSAYPALTLHTFVRSRLPTEWNLWQDVGDVRVYGETGCRSCRPVSCLRVSCGTRPTV